MFSFAKPTKDSSSSASSTGKPPPITRHDTFGSQELFEAWAKDSFITQNTIDILVKTHEINCLPAVLALKKEDFPYLNLPVGQRRLLENAVEKLRQEYELVQPPTPKAMISLEMPLYKSMLEIGELAEENAELETDGDSGSFDRLSCVKSGSVPEKKSFHARSQVPAGKDEQDFGPEKEALLISGKGKTSASRGAPGKRDGKSFTRKSTEYSASKNLDDKMEDDDEYTACACQRWLFVTICMPLFVVLSIVGFILLVLLMPLRLCCSKGGVYSNVVTFLFEVFLMAPCLACKWASGKSKFQNNSPSGKSCYGGTDDVELGNK